MLYHYFLVDFNDTGYMYRVGVASDESVTLACIKDYFKQYSKDILYMGSAFEVKKRYLKSTRQIPCGEIFYTQFMFDKCMRVSKEHWSSRLRRKLLTMQDGQVQFIYGQH